MSNIEIIDKLESLIEKKYLLVKRIDILSKTTKFLNHCDSKLEIIANTFLQNREEKTNNNYKIHQPKNENLNLAAGVGTFTVSLLSSVHPFFWYTSIIGICYIAKDIFKSAYISVVYERKLNVDTLVAPIIIVCVAKGYIILCGLQTLIATVNRYVLAKVKTSSKNEIMDIFQNYPKNVWIFVQGTEVQIPFKQLQANDVVIVIAGETVPVDGHIIDGNAMVDQQVLTGESQYVEKTVGDEVLALTTVLKGKIFIRAVKTGDATTVAQIANVLNNTVDFKSKKQYEIEKLSDKTIAPTIAASVISTPFLGPLGAVAIMQAHPKYKTTIASYIGILATLDKAAQQGILIKDGRALDSLCEVDTVIFDKTGTLTDNTLQINDIICYNSFSANELLVFAAASEQKQAHPIAQALIKECRKRNLSIPKTSEVEYSMGFGISTIIEGEKIHIGSLRFLEKNGIKNECSHPKNKLITGSDMCVYICVNSKIAGCFVMMQQIRKDANNVICELKKRNMDIYILSGDTETATKKIADTLGIKYFSEVLPDQKAFIVKKLQKQGKKICFIGDGINDTIALKFADVSISISGASSVAQDIAQVILLDESISQIPKLFELADEMSKKMNKTFRLVVIPHIFAFTGIMLLGFQLIHVILIGQMALILGVKNSLSGKNIISILRGVENRSNKQLSDN